MTIRLILIAAALLAGVPVLEARTWTEAGTGRTIEAEFVSVAGDDVTLRRADGKTISLALDRLSDADRAFVVEQGQQPGLGAEQWPRWRGAADQGSVADGKRYPDSLGEDDLAWKVELPGRGCSTPIVWDGKIIVTCVANGKDVVVAYDLDGQELWRAEVGDAYDGKHRNGSGSNPSPVTDGEIIAVHFKSGNVAALDLDGKMLWSNNVEKAYGKVSLFWDFGTSPVLTQKHVVATVMHDGESYLVAFGREDGGEEWRTDRTYETPKEGDHSYATPVVIDSEGREMIVSWGAEHVTGHDAASGELLWECGNFNPQQKKNWCIVASFVIADDVVVVPYGRGEMLAGVKLGGEGDVTGSHRKWERDDTGAFCPTPLVYKGDVYLLRDRGGVECLDPASGEAKWSEALPRGSGSFYASPLIADGKLYAAREDGVVFVAEIGGGKLEVLSENEMGEQMIASPVAVGGRLLLRGEKHLFCAMER